MHTDALPQGGQIGLCCALPTLGNRSYKITAPVIENNPKNSIRFINVAFIKQSFYCLDLGLINALGDVEVLGLCVS